MNSLIPLVKESKPAPSERKCCLLYEVNTVRKCIDKSISLSNPMPGPIRPTLHIPFIPGLRWG